MACKSLCLPLSEYGFVVNPYSYVVERGFQDFYEYFALSLIICKGIPCELVKSIGYPTIESYWITGPSNGTPVYMLYNPNSYENFYTADAAEKDYLVTLGWLDRGIQFYATNGFRDSASVYRLYNPNADGIGAHHYTDDAAERDWLVSLGWNDEGVAWYVAAKSDTGTTVFGSKCLDYMMADKIGYTLKQTGYITDDGFEYDPNFYQKPYYVGVKK